MKKRKYIFVGNRNTVLKEMMKASLDIEKILVLKGSYLEKEVKNKKIHTFESKKELFKIINSTKFDVLVSNGCPFILPVSSLKKKHQVFVNVHPSFLPDLKGINPISGAMLFGRNGGATCHIMDDKIDNGPIISRIEIPLTPDVDLGLLYKLSFAAEAEVFCKALKRNFVPDKKISLKLPGNRKPIYYSRSDKDFVIDFSEDNKSLVRRVKAFGIISQQAYFRHNGSIFKVMDAEVIKNPYVLSKLNNYKELQVAFFYDRSIVFRKGREFIKFSGISGDIEKLEEGDVLG